ncbi:hypothetical protein [Geomicrobium sp. JCM 19055]|uniref:hypothetical protein n=1 Tax=Geomicrobium sp. JCM 19055 TaxID=1460649 RepID=UPI00272E841F|nr:hypothetical protein [Geomicrobium sp. JCM 19055]
MMYPQEYRLEERFEDLGYDVATDSEQMADYYLEETVQILNGRLGKVTKNDFILGMRLKTESVKVDAELKENVFSMFSTATDTIINLLGWEQDVSASFFSAISRGRGSGGKCGCKRKRNEVKRRRIDLCESI